MSHTRTWCRNSGQAGYTERRTLSAIACWCSCLMASKPRMKHASFSISSPLATQEARDERAKRACEAHQHPPHRTLENIQVGEEKAAVLHKGCVSEDGGCTRNCTQVLQPPAGYGRALVRRSIPFHIAVERQQRHHSLNGISRHNLVHILLCTPSCDHSAPTQRCPRPRIALHCAVGLKPAGQSAPRPLRRPVA